MLNVFIMRRFPQQVTFHEKIRTRAVTLDGDVFDPSGTLTGGAKSSSSGVLLELQKLQTARSELTACEAALAKLTASLKQLGTLASKYDALTTKRDMKQNELEILLVKLDSNESYKVCRVWFAEESERKESDDVTLKI